VSFGIYDGRQFSVRIDGPEFRSMLFAFARIDSNHFEGHAGFLQEQRDFEGIRRRGESKNGSSSVSFGLLSGKIRVIRFGNPVSVQGMMRLLRNSPNIRMNISSVSTRS
jgi:hypothetical protein